MKKIYFGCSISGGRDHDHLYSDIVTQIKQAGAQLLSEMFAEKELRPEVGMKLDPVFVYSRDIGWIKQSDGLIMEVTQPSLGVGYEIAFAEAHNKPILALFYTPSNRRLSSMISGNSNVKVLEYKNPKELKAKIHAFVAAL